MSILEQWIKSRNIDEVECLVPDITGIARGKIVPADKFLKGIEDKGLRIPEDIFTQAVTGDYVDGSSIVSSVGLDVLMDPDPATIRIVPWYPNPTAQIVCDTRRMNGELVDIAPRSLLKRILAMYADLGWKPVVAPELEFYLTAKNLNPDEKLQPPIGQNGRREYGRQAYGIEAANEFDPVMDMVYDYCEASDIDLDMLIHEGGSAQLELNFNHGDALDLADQVFLFKRTVRQAAIKHDMYATFMAKPHEMEAGSSMHIHQSVVEIDSGKNIFATDDGNNTELLMHYIGGLQKYIGPAMPLFAANVNSYRRLSPYSDAPVNSHWGYDNRTVGLRVPESDARGRRVENRLPGADCNPYLAMAGTLACGLLGITEKRQPAKVVEGDAYKLAYNLPRHQHDALHKMVTSKPLKDVLGERFVKNLREVKDAEYDLFHKVISSWERENLLLNV